MKTIDIIRIYYREKNGAAKIKNNTNTETKLARHREIFPAEDNG